MEVAQTNLAAQDWALALVNCAGAGQPGYPAARCGPHSFSDDAPRKSYTSLGGPIPKRQKNAPQARIPSYAEIRTRIGSDLRPQLREFREAGGYSAVRLGDASAPPYGEDL